VCTCFKPIKTPNKTGRRLYYNIAELLYQQICQVSQPVNHDKRLWKSQAMVCTTQAEWWGRMTAAQSVWQADTEWECYQSSNGTSFTSPPAGRSIELPLLSVHCSSSLRGDDRLWARMRQSETACMWLFQTENWNFCNTPARHSSPNIELNNRVKKIQVCLNGQVDQRSFNDWLF